MKIPCKVEGEKGKEKAKSQANASIYNPFAGDAIKRKGTEAKGK